MSIPRGLSRRDLGRAAVLAGGALATVAADGMAPARADTPCDLQLILAVDTSGSVNQVRFELQKQGYVAAFRNPRVVKAIRSGMTQAIAVSMVQWTGQYLQQTVVPWTLLKDEATTHRFAAAIEAAPRQLFSGGTSISGVVDHGRSELFARSPFSGGRRVIDISGDGANNRGRPAGEARDDAVKAGITINGLPIMGLEPFLDEHYKSQVIGGVNAFMVVASSYDAFADAILKKLITEIATPGDPAHGASFA